MKNILIVVFCFFSFQGSSQHSIAREWNEELLHAIRNDFARPTVHARNLFHMSVAMYDVWSVIDGTSTPYFLGDTINGFFIPFDGFTAIGDKREELHEAISFAAYRIMRARFRYSPGAIDIFNSLNAKFDSLGYDQRITSIDYASGDGATLGNYVAEQILSFGLQDGSNEEFDYENKFYLPLNEALVMDKTGNPNMDDPNRWQPLSLNLFIDQSGNEVAGSIPAFLSPEWGSVSGFALTEEELTIFDRNESEYWVYHDPGPPPYLDSLTIEENEAYQWNFGLVSQWSSHLDPDDGVLWDISPGSLGNTPVDSFPSTLTEFKNFYKIDGGDLGKGHDINPFTELPYTPQIVARGDYARVLAEFWADGPDSETPPGHWFTILNYVSDHPLLEKRFEGEGPLVEALEWDVKTYFILAAAMHDSAISTWGIKGWYDYPRPVSAIRYMAERGQSTDSLKLNYDPMGLPLIDGFIELVEAEDSLFGDLGEFVGELKIKTWKGPDYITDPDTSYAGVDWILAKDWWPYQRPTFVSPPFAGYVSGHSTFSRAAAEVLTKMTGSAYFPGGLGEFNAKKNEFLVFEEGPHEDIILQWATYRDASDQTSLSRIWGGIHPPADDIPGRLIGIEIAKQVFNKAHKYFNDFSTPTLDVIDESPLINVYPNPAQADAKITIQFPDPFRGDILVSDLQGKLIYKSKIIDPIKSLVLDRAAFSMVSGSYIVSGVSDSRIFSKKVIIIRE